MHRYDEIRPLITDSHKAASDAGWWNDLHTGACIKATRNRGEIMMLIVSELSEASEGLASGAPDDKLPQYPMYHVELADAAIRLGDLIGAEDGSIHPDAFLALALGASNAHLLLSMQGRLMHIVNAVSRAMEHHRKGRKDEYVKALFGALAAVIALADRNGIPVAGIAAEKRAFNAKRPDHQVENRKAEGGKAY